MHKSRWPSSRSMLALVSVGLFASLVLLAACATEQPLPADPTARLFARGLDEITDLYIEPVSSRKLALSGTARLARLDDKFHIAESPAAADKTALILSYNGQQVAAYTVPEDDGARDWGVIVARLIADAKSASPQLAALPQEQIDKAVFDGITGALDPFSRYSPPDLALDQRAARDGFGGIGVTLDMSNEELRITAVTPHGPADRVGIRAGDKIVAIDGSATAGRSQVEVIHQLRGPLFSTVEVTVSRAGARDRRSFRVQRELIVAPTVTLSRDGTIAVIHVASFNQSTTQRLTDSLHEAQRESGGRLSGVVLDLRGNPGGLLDQAVSLADVFIAEGPIVSTVGRNPASH